MSGGLTNYLGLNKFLVTFDLAFDLQNYFSIMIKELPMT